MKLLNHHIILCICSLLIIFVDIRGLSGQETTSHKVRTENETLYSDRINEKIYLRTDRLFYIAGERIWFRIFLLEENTLEPLGFSKVAYVELLDGHNKIILQQKIKMDQSGGSGFLDIPMTVPSGYYFLRSYSYWMRNYNPSGYFMTTLAVINPAAGLYENMDSSAVSVKINLPRRNEEIGHFVMNKPEDHLNIKINDNNIKYKCREKVDLEIVTTDAKGNPLTSDVSVSVFYSGDKEFHAPGIEDYLFSDSGMNLGMTVESDSDFLYEAGQRHLYFPEMEGITISGKIVEPDTQNPVSDVPVILSVIGENAFLKSCLTRKDGRFYFSLDDIFDENEVVLSYGDPADEFLIIMDEPYSEFYAELPGIQLNLDESWRSFIEKQMINFQLNTLYTGKRESYIADSHRNQQPFYVEPDATIRMEDFIRLPNMEEVFRELVKQVLVTRENGQLKLNVLDYNTNRIIGPEPLFILDGVPFFNVDLILELNPEDISQINIVSQKYYKGILEMDGIIDIRTNKGNLPISDLPGNSIRQVFQGYQPHQEYMCPDYPDEMKLKSRIPDFRNLLYWNPSVRTYREGKAHVSFYASDNTGNYVIRIEGMTDYGVFGSASDSLIVTK